MLVTTTSSSLTTTTATSATIATNSTVITTNNKNRIISNLAITIPREDNGSSGINNFEDTANYYGTIADYSQPVPVAPPLPPSPLPQTPTSRFGPSSENIVKLIDVLMPNGTLISLSLAPACTFFEIKDEIFELSQKGPMYGALRDPKSYIFIYVDPELGSQKEIDDEEIRLCDACPFGGVLKLLERKEDSATLELDEQIGQLIGKPLKDFDALRSPEVNEFRSRMRTLCEEIVKSRQANSWIDKMRYAFPTSVDRFPSNNAAESSGGEEVPLYLSNRLPKDGTILVKISFEKPKFTIDLSVNYRLNSDELIKQTINELCEQPTMADLYRRLLEEHGEFGSDQSSMLYDTSFGGTEMVTLRNNYHQPRTMVIDSGQYLLKVNGCLEYLLGNHQLIQYKVIQEQILTNQTIHLVAIRRQSIEFEDEPIYSVPDFNAQRQRSQSVISLGSLSTVILSTRRRPQIFSSWTIDRKLLIRIHGAKRIVCQSDITRVAVMVEIFHGGDSLCDTIVTSTQPVPPSSAEPSITWDEDVVFNLKVSDLPRMARLAFAFVGYTGSSSGSSGNQKKSSKSSSSSTASSSGQSAPVPLSWANINFYDYRGNLRETSTTLSLWPHDSDNDCQDCGDSTAESVFNPLGTVVSNPNLEQSTCLTISFTKYSEGTNSIIRYPDLKEISVCNNKNNGNSLPQSSQISAQTVVDERPEDEKEEEEEGLGIGEEVEDEENEEENEYESTYDYNNKVIMTSGASGGGGGGGRKQPIQVNGKVGENVTLNVTSSVTSSVTSTVTNNTSNIDPTPMTMNRTKTSHASKQFLDQIKEICDRDLLHKMSSQECELLWFLRQDCRTLLPNSLSKLLISFKWNNQKMIGETLNLLQSWPKLSPFLALELLDYAYADSMVRKFAIECLKDISHDELSQYLLQLVQALKYESYIYNDLVQFLLERAFENQRIGHSLFWLLRSEMHDPAVSVTFGLILEAYCRGAVDHIHILSRQMECLNKLKRINEFIRADKSRDNRDKKILLMQDMLCQKYYQETLCNVINPLNPRYKLGHILVKKCKFMDSKMKPLWLVFENQDQDAQNVYLIFKNGDDLRQDMLTLQMIGIMDKLWKAEGLDFRMTPYRCISLEHKVGLIEVVLNADTIANIQKEKGSAAIAAFKKGSLFSWLRDHNPNEDQLNSAIEEFTHSCAGYCVATYILGIADRHNDNIMVKRNGQMFHIDFGHILGKFKEKFGIRRERVPFVLTHDFVYVITHGGQNPQKTEYFNRFQQYCEEAFLIIRRKGSFIISLFAMMLSTGIPEVSSVDDLNYLRETLVLDLTEDQARTHFRQKFTDALRNSWKTSFNWCAHSLAKDNRMNE